VKILTFEKYPKIYTFYKYPYECKELRYNEESIRKLLQNPEAKMVVQEKIDGANFRFKINKNGNIIFGSRRRTLGEENVKKITEISGNWHKCIEYIKEVLSKKFGEHVTEKLKIFAGFTFYGECCVPHTIKYNWDKIPPFIGFDIRYPDGSWMDYISAITTFTGLGFKFVPIIKMVTVEEAMNWTKNDVPKSVYYDGKAEGVVFKNYEFGIFTKFITDDFRERNKEVFGNSPKHVIDESEKFIAKYVTNDRIEHVIYKLMDEGYEIKNEKFHGLDIKMMAVLPKQFTEDLFKEEWHGILFGNYNQLNLNLIRKKLIPARCLAVLKSMIAVNEYANSIK